MKKNLSELRNKTVKELEKEVKDTREEIAKLKLEIKVNPTKDTNMLAKKNKTLARRLTILTEKKYQQEVEKLGK